jgi:hypothetical protein
MIMRTRTPRPAAGSMASDAKTPMLSLLQMKYCTAHCVTAIPEA